MRKRLVSVLLVLMIVCGLFAGCGKSEQTSEERKLTIGIPQNANVTSYEENGFTSYIEESLDVELEFVYFTNTASEYMQQLALMVSSGEKMPDVLWGFTGMDNNARAEYGGDGYFLDLTELVKSNAPNYQAQFEKLSAEEQERITRKGTSYDGAFYGMPLLTETHIDNLQSMMFINQTWLDKLGLQAPTNTEELYNVLKAFKEKDPNGNGKADEVPMLGNMGSDVNLCNYIINAFTYYDFANEYNVDTEGKLWNPSISEEYRQAVIYMNKLCEEGLLSDLSFAITSTTEFKNMYTPSNEVALVGVMIGHPGLYTDRTNPVLDEYVSLAALGDESGKGGYTVVRPDTLAFCSTITSDCKNPELAMEFLDFFYLDETVTRARHGVKGEDWVVAEKPGIDSLGNETSIEVLNGQAFFSGSSTWCHMGNSIFSAQNYNAISDEEGDLTQSTWELVKNARTPEAVAVDLVYTAEEYEFKSQWQTQMKDYILKARAEFVVGTKDANSDSDWNEYLTNMEKLHASELRDVAQKAYDREIADK